MGNDRSAITLLSDLMFQVKIAEAGKKAGVNTLFVDSAAKLLELADRQNMIIIDINFSRAEPLEVIKALKASPATQNIPLIGYVSHVQVELRAAAAKAGCDVVLARSAFVQSCSELLARCAASSSVNPERLLSEWRST